MQELFIAVHEKLAAEIHRLTGYQMKKVPTSNYYNVIHLPRRFGLGFNHSKIYVYNNYNEQMRQRIRAYSAWSLPCHVVQDYELRNPQNGHIVNFDFPQDFKFNADNVRERLLKITEDLVKLGAFD